MENEEAKWAVENNCGIGFIKNIEDIECIPRQAFYEGGKLKVTNLGDGIQHTLEWDHNCGDGETMEVWIKSTKTVDKSTIYRYKKYLKQGGEGFISLYTL